MLKGNASCLLRVYCVFRNGNIVIIVQLLPILNYLAGYRILSGAHIPAACFEFHLYTIIPRLNQLTSISFTAPFCMPACVSAISSAFSVRYTLLCLPVRFYSDPSARFCAQQNIKLVYAQLCKLVRHQHGVKPCHLQHQLCLSL